MTLLIPTARKSGSTTTSVALLQSWSVRWFTANTAASLGFPRRHLQSTCSVLYSLHPVVYVGSVVAELFSTWITIIYKSYILIIFTLIIRCVYLMLSILLLSIEYCASIDCIVTISVFYYTEEYSWRCVRRTAPSMFPHQWASIVSSISAWRPPGRRIQRGGRTPLCCPPGPSVQSRHLPCESYSNRLPHLPSRKVFFIEGLVDSFDSSWSSDFFREECTRCFEAGYRTAGICFVWVSMWKWWQM